MNWYMEALKKYAVFTGRSRRTEFWTFVLGNFVISFVLMMLDVVISGFGFLAMLFGLAVFIPGLAVGVRRLHDTSRSGWWILIGLVPIIGLIVMIIFGIQDSHPGSNEYGPNPKGA